MASMALSRAKAGADARLNEEKRAAEKKRNILVLCARYFQDLGYINTVMQIQSETGVSLNKIDVADNIDLGTILTEYEDFYEMRFGRRPKITRKQEVEKDDKKDHKSRHCSLPRLNEDGSDDRRGAANRSKSEDKANRRQRPPSIPDDEARISAGQPSALGASGREGPGDSLGIAGQNVSKASSSSGSKKEVKCEAQDKPGDEFYENQVLRALPNCGVDKDYRELALTISRDILSRNPGVPWSSIVGLGHAKALLKEAVVMPLKYPQLFTGLLAPWKGVLLFGPPGTGKTLLAKAVATECKTTFFNISASTVVSKWRGDSEKLIRVLFDLARHHQPSTIFMDEIDSIMSTREGGGSEHEGSRRMKTELLIQMDGLSRDSSDQVFVLAASNLPWDLDSAMLRRLEKRILVSLPSAEAREVMFRVNLPENVAQEIEYTKLASLTEDWSGSDIRLLCKEAAMHPLRRLMAEIERAEVEQEQKAQDKPNRRSAAEKAAQKSLEKAEPAAISELKVGAVTEADVTRALQTVHRAPAAHLDRYNQWQDQFGAA